MGGEAIQERLGGPSCDDVQNMPVDQEPEPPERRRIQAIEHKARRRKPELPGEDREEG